MRYGTSLLILIIMLAVGCKASKPGDSQACAENDQEFYKMMFTLDDGPFYGEDVAYEPHIPKEEW